MHNSSDTEDYPGMFQDTFRRIFLDRGARDEEPFVVNSINGLGWYILRALRLDLTWLDEVFAPFYARVRMRPTEQSDFIRVRIAETPYRYTPPGWVLPVISLCHASEHS